jgi:hypothetical protein
MVVTLCVEECDESRKCGPVIHSLKTNPTCVVGNVRYHPPRH